MDPQTPVEPAVPESTAPSQGAPPVVAVVVAHDPGPWFEEVLTALGAQDYPDLSVLVIDAASADDPTARVADVLPGAFVRRLDHNPGFGAAANEVLRIVEGASHFLFLHDDAAPGPMAVRRLVEEAYRSNAGIVSPKLVAWDNEELLLTVGMSADKAGNAMPFGRNELDQEQYDAVRDVFVAPGGAQLVRADLFAALGGFDEDITMFGEDLDLCWRAQLAGARVIVAPDARVRHLEATAAGIRPLELGDAPGSLTDRVRPLELRHRLRTVLKAYGRFHLLRVLPQLLLLATGELLYSLAARRTAALRAIVGSWRWNLQHRAGLRAARKHTQQSRSLSDGSIRRLQARGSARLNTFVRGQIAVEERTLGVGAASRELAGALRRGGLKLAIAVWATVALVVVVGSRSLLTGELAAVGQLQAFDAGPVELARHYVSGWRTTGLGSESPAPVAFAVLAAFGSLLAGAMGALQKILVLGALPLGIAGAWRMTRAVGSPRGRLVAVALYAAVPLPYDALAQGSWAGLLAYASAPYLLVRMLRASGVAPWGAAAPDETPVRRRRRVEQLEHHHRVSAVDDVGEQLGAEAGHMDPIAAEEYLIAEGALHGRPDYDDDVDELPPPPPVWRFVELPELRAQMIPAGVVLAIVLALAPSLVAMVAVLAAGFALGGLAAGQWRAGLRAVALLLGGLGLAAALLFPWTLAVVLPGAGWSPLAGVGDIAARAPSWGQLLRFHTGPMGAGPLGWALLVAAALPLLIARRWRLQWATHLWAVALVSWGVAFVAGRGWLGVPPPTVEVLLAPAAVVLPLLAALGLASFETDLPGYQFGWRQVASIVAATASVVAVGPVLVGAVDGRWGMPSRDLPELLSWMPERTADGPFRVLWVGDARVVPGDPWRIDDRLAYTTSENGPPSVVDLWPGPDDGATGLLADALVLARRDRTTRLGHLLAPMGVRYIVVPSQAAPGGKGLRRAPPADISASLRQQIDLRLLDSDEAVTVYENAAWAPPRAVLPPAAVEAAARTGPDAARSADLAGATAVLADRRGPASFTGEVPADVEIFVSEAHSDGWRLEVSGEDLSPRRAFGWALIFTSGEGGEARLRHRASPLHFVGLLIQLVLWIVVVRAAFRGLRAHRAVVLADRREAT